MVIHPPSLYTGFVGMTIPFAFGMAALITGHLDDSWLRAVRRWTMISWLFLSFGLTLGMIWAYEELGWGGFWGWDPVENAGLLPWFTATAFLHSVIVQERRSMLRVWNVTLVIIDVLPDHLRHLHDPVRRRAVGARVRRRSACWRGCSSIFMVVILVFSFGFVIYRLPLLRARNELDSWVSREAAFLVNNWILLFSAIFILFATMFPTLSEAWNGNRLTVERGLLQQVDGADRLVPAVPDRLRPAAGLAEIDAQQSARSVPVADARRRGHRRRADRARRARLVVGAVLRALGVRDRDDRAGVLAGHERAPGRDRHRLLTALVGLVGRNKRRYGGYIVHLGIMLMFLGFAGSGFKRDLDAAGEARRQESTLGSLHAAQRRRQGQRRRPEADGHRVHRGVQGRQADRHDVPGEVVLPQARGGADDGSRRSAGRSRRISTSCWRSSRAISRRSRRACRS